MAINIGKRCQNESPGKAPDVCVYTLNSCCLCGVQSKVGMFCSKCECYCMPAQRCAPLSFALLSVVPSFFSCIVFFWGPLINADANVKVQCLIRQLLKCRLSLCCFGEDSVHCFSCHLCLTICLVLYNPEQLIHLSSLCIFPVHFMVIQNDHYQFLYFGGLIVLGENSSL